MSSLREGDTIVLISISSYTASIVIELVISAVSVMASFAVGLFVFLRRPGHVVHQLYALLTLSLILFSISNLLAMGDNHRLIYIRLVMVFCSLMVVLFYYFLYNIATQQIKLRGLHFCGVITTIGIIILDFTPFVFSSLPPERASAPVPNIGAVLFLSHFLIYLLLSIVLLFKQMKRTNVRKRMQYKSILLGILPVLLFAPVTGFLVPVLFRDTSYIFLGPVYVLWFVLTLSFAVIRHGLFNIKLIIARSAGYVLTLGALALLYGFIIFGLLATILNISVPLLSQVIVSLFIAITASILRPLKQFFDRVTNILFYRDSYDARLLLDDLGQILIGTVSLDELVNKTVKVITSTLKVHSAQIGVLSRGVYESYASGSLRGLGISGDLIVEIQEYLAKIQEPVLIVDSMPDEQSSLRESCLSQGVFVFVRITHDFSRAKGEVAYIALGQKMSGYNYTKQDATLLGTVSKELFVGIQNALQVREIKNFNVTLQEKVDNATGKLRRTNEKLRQIDQSKDEFISMASHQLRTPLTSVKGYISMVLEGDVGEINDGQRKMLTQAFVSSQRMASLIADLLNVSRLRTGKFVIEPSAVDLSKLVDDEISQLKETAVGRGLTLEFKKPTSFPVLMLDETKTRQVVMNFVDNAIYYTPSGGEIEVLLRSGEKSVDFVVRDNGIGVPKTEQLHLFTKFFRAGNARKARPDGTGLGLFMAKKVIVAQGGAVTFKSTEGKGSEFGFTFPLNKVIAK